MSRSYNNFHSYSLKTFPEPCIPNRIIDLGDNLPILLMGKQAQTIRIFREVVAHWMRTLVPDSSRALSTTLWSLFTSKFFFFIIVHQVLLNNSLPPLLCLVDFTKTPWKQKLFGDATNQRCKEKSTFGEIFLFNEISLVLQESCST